MEIAVINTLICTLYAGQAIRKGHCKLRDGDSEGKSGSERMQKMPVQDLRHSPKILSYSFDNKFIGFILACIHVHIFQFISLA
ncbi:MAG: hypothetical protein RBR69_10125, partial [Candidatus Cloacimonadaceae bacterium]|nr:hypothetical protein [Candidatus Cloacimonadaceae bacterium]